jgi:hypothetical protein
MRTRSRRRPNPATPIALLALFIALGGTAMAAKHYIISSTGQIKPTVLKQLRASAPGQIVRALAARVVPSQEVRQRSTAGGGYYRPSRGLAA